MIEGIHWIAGNRASFPGLIAAGEIPDKYTRVESPFDEADDFIVGSLGDVNEFVPVLLVLRTHSAKEVLAWLATYSSASFPISQSIRCMTAADLRDGGADACALRSANRNRSWACVVLGELLGQGEFQPALEGVAVSRASACFSFAYARAHGTYKQGVMVSSCSRRLKLLESDALFVKRAVKVDELKPIWDTLIFDPGESTASEGGIAALFDLLKRDVSRLPNMSTAAFNEFSLDAGALASGTMEARVRSFEAFLQSIRGRIDDHNTSFAAMLVAAAAIMVGNGTSHISLLAEFGKRIPAVFAWFGLFAARLGAKFWDPAWNRTVNSVARLVDAKFELTDVPTADLAWVEYEFVKTLPRPAEFVRHVPKFYPKLLTIEVVPGASCQFRLIDDASKSSVSSVEASTPVIKQDGSALALQDFERSLREFEQRVGLMRSIVQRTIVSVGEPEQANLFDASKKIFKRSRQPKK